MMIELLPELETALKLQANAHGVSVEHYVQVIVERDLAPSLDVRQSLRPFKTSFGALAHLGPGPSAEEIDQNRAEMFRNFGESF
jgi:plasmid stability protein